MSVRAETPAEIGYISQIDACQALPGGATVLTNHSNLTWSIAVGGTDLGPADSHLRYENVNPAGVATLSSSPSALLLPGSTVTILYLPKDVSWHFDPVESAVFQGAEALQDRAVEGTALLATSLFGRDTPYGRALQTCAKIIAVHALDERLSLDDGNESVTALVGEALSGTAGAATCISQWRQAEALSGTTALTADELEDFSASRVASTLEHFDTGWSRAVRILSASEILKFVLHQR